ncbi:MAG: type II toxin-antitoxin system HicB family antitoxin [Methylococcales bacterium]|nr:type II toxin-antitoxin system HicB family antitoxin [Methylococcales bacterium]
MKNFYLKVVEWSDEDGCFIGSCPDLFYGGCHGDDEKQVFAELCQLVEETIACYHSEAKALPQAKHYKFFENQSDCGLPT